MSLVRLLAIDRPLPAVNCQTWRKTMIGGTALGMERGFLIEPLVYYKNAVEEAAALRALSMKPCRYEFSIEETPEDLARLCAYLRENCSPGSEVELWALWLGDEDRRPPRFRGSLNAFDMETPRQFLEAEQICLTVTI